MPSSNPGIPQGLTGLTTKAQQRVHRMNAGDQRTIEQGIFAHSLLNENVIIECRP